MSRQPQLYRVPSAPGYIGRFNWRAILVFLLGLIAANTVSTQYIAASFEYQPGLGQPFWRLGSGAVYQPFAWLVWGWQHLSEFRDARIARPFIEGLMILILGSLLSVLALFIAAGSRSRKLSKNADHLRGSARWATGKDVRKTGLLTASRGVYVGAWSPERAAHLHYLRHNGPEHVLAFAPTRSGKGVGLVIPTLLAWDESTIVYDIKGENWAKTAGFRASMGHLCFKFSPVEEASSSRFNPLAELRLYTKRDVSDAQNIANMIVRTGEDSPQERYWENAAASITTGMILHVAYKAALEGRVASLADLANEYTRPDEKFREYLEDEVVNFEHDPQLARGWRLPNGTKAPTHPTVKSKAREMLNKEDKDFSGVLSTVVTALSLYCDPIVAENTSASDFTIHDLVNHERPVSLYLVVPPSDKIRLRPLIRLIFTMIVNRLTEKMSFLRAAQKKNRHRLLFLIDEFPSLNRMEIFADALSYMAGYGLKAYLVTQDIRQIEDAYGPKESIVSNCHVQIAYAPNNQDTKELLSKAAGTTTVPRASYNFSGSRFAPVMHQLTGSVDYDERPLLTPDEAGRLRPAEKEGEGDAEQIIAPGQMLIFVSGHYPILGTQMLYFLDPELNRRSEIAPPSDFFTIEDSAVIPQKPLDRTINVISKAEFAPREAPHHQDHSGEAPTTETGSLSQAQNTFLEQLQLDL